MPEVFSIVMVVIRESGALRIKDTIRMVKKTRISVVCYDTGIPTFLSIRIVTMHKSHAPKVQDTIRTVMPL